MNLKPFITDIPDFPKPGIIFKDLSPLYLNAASFQSAIEQLLAILPSADAIDKVVGIESRGFIMGSVLAQHLDAGFVTVRKKGKLPGNILSRGYDLEYGSATLEIQKDAIKEGEHVLIHDDVLATGGTAKATCDLVEDLGGIIVQCNFLVELASLKGRANLKAPIGTLLTC